MDVAPHEEAPSLERSSSSSSNHNNLSGSSSRRLACPKDDSGVATLSCHRHLVMKTSNTIAPFDSVQVPGDFRFTFLHSNPGKFFDLAKVRELSSSRVAIFPKHVPF
jgi:hypothetical protein